jgi:hypothetical protein
MFAIAPENGLQQEEEDRVTKLDEEGEASTVDTQKQV